ncbi:MAG: o-succinylbenzoate synthase [Crocinitomicaceae bacterium]|nr:o-succinylbenzoate synthase [Crocinitomicaceae bacterium]
MELNASLEKKTFQFKRPSGTSRGILTEKHAWFITVWEASNPDIKGVGECSIIIGLSPDFKDFETYELKLQAIISNVNHFKNNLHEIVDFPSIYFGLETALLDLKNGGKGIYFDTPFTQGKQAIPINGLVWMGDKDFMLAQVKTVLRQGFNCVKIKIGAIDFEQELAILDYIRSEYSSQEIVLRVDANGAFSASEALQKLQMLSNFDIHSIEQPIASGQWNEMRELCEKSPVPIALDEELIGIHDNAIREKLLHGIQPQYIILKPSLHGGLYGTRKWIQYAEKMKIQWWITSALESNVGLDAIAQFTSLYEPKSHQGLGTGSLYLNNTPSPLMVQGGFLRRG